MCSGTSGSSKASQELLKAKERLHMIQSVEVGGVVVVCPPVAAVGSAGLLASGILVTTSLAAGGKRRNSTFFFCTCTPGVTHVPQEHCDPYSTTDPTRAAHFGQCSFAVASSPTCARIHFTKSPKNQELHAGSALRALSSSEVGWDAKEAPENDFVSCVRARQWLSFNSRGERVPVANFRTLALRRQVKSCFPT